MLHIAHQVQAKRLSLNFSQKTLSERSGVSLGVIKKFEHSGKISLESLLKLALVLDALNDFEFIFKFDPQKFNSIAELLKEETSRKRGRQ